MSLKGLINREIKAQKEFLVGRVLTIRELKPGDPLNGDKRVWYCDVDVGGNRILRDVLIKTAGSGVAGRLSSGGRPRSFDRVAIDRRRRERGALTLRACDTVATA